MNSPRHTLKIAEPENEGPPKATMMVVEHLGQLLRVEFWSDRQWAMIPEEERPEATRTHSDDGWFLTSKVV